MLRRALAAEERAALEQRAAELRAALVPIADDQHDAVARAVSAMLGGFSQMLRKNDAEAVAITNGYLTVMRERPAWAIVATCLKVRAGSAGTSLDFPPPEPRLNWLVGETLAPYRARLAAIERLLAAKIA